MVDKMVDKKEGTKPHTVTLPLILLLMLSMLGLTGCRDADRSSGRQQALNEPRLVVEKVIVNSDKDGDGILDLDDIVEGARKDARAKPIYKDAYYAGGYPPDNEGVCTDVIWRAFKSAGYDLKGMMDLDIEAHPGDYPRVGGMPEPNIDFRRVPNQEAYFKKYANVLPVEIKPWDPENLKQWQGGDIVVYGPPYDHIGIVSNQRRPDGVPLLIHNAGPWTKEDDRLLTWPSPLKYHFRYPNPD